MSCHVRVYLMDDDARWPNNALTFDVILESRVVDEPTSILPL